MQGLKDHVKDVNPVTPPPRKKKPTVEHVDLLTPPRVAKGHSGASASPARPAHAPAVVP